MAMDGRKYSPTNYRYGFNGKEKDDEVKGDGNSLDFGARIHDPRIGRFMSVDRDFAKFTSETPYNFAGSSPLVFIDKNGDTKTIYYTIYEKDGSVRQMVTTSVGVKWSLTLHGLKAYDYAQHVTVDRRNNTTTRTITNTIVDYSKEVPFRDAAYQTALELDGAVKGAQTNNPTIALKSVEVGVRKKYRVNEALEISVEVKNKSVSESDLGTFKISGKATINPSFSTSKSDVSGQAKTLISGEQNIFLKLNLDEKPQVEGTAKAQAFNMYAQINRGVNGITSLEFGLTDESNPDIKITPIKMTTFEISTNGCESVDVKSIKDVFEGSTNTNEPQNNSQ